MKEKLQPLIAQSRYQTQQYAEDRMTISLILINRQGDPTAYFWQHCVLLFKYFRLYQFVMNCNCNFFCKNFTVRKTTFSGEKKHLLVKYTNYSTNVGNKVLPSITFTCFLQEFCEEFKLLQYCCTLMSTPKLCTDSNYCQLQPMQSSLEYPWYVTVWHWTVTSKFLCFIQTVTKPVQNRGLHI